jgi:DNA invertase Pin-like site-specific DNA recombinase
MKRGDIMAVIGYIRYVGVNTKKHSAIEQRLSNHISIDEYVSDRYSLMHGNRDNLNELINTMTNNDTLVVDKLKHVANTLDELVAFLDIVLKKEILFISLKEKINTSQVQSKIMIQTIYNIKEFNKDIIYDKQEIGIIRAKGEKQYKGRAAKSYRDFEDFKKYYNELEYKRITKKEMAQLLNVSRPTLDKLIKQYKK